MEHTLFTGQREREGGRERDTESREYLPKGQKGQYSLQRERKREREM
jgi:hypothetical protein